MKAGKIRVELELDDGRFVQRVVRAGTSLETLQRTVRSNIKDVELVEKKTASFGHALRDVTVTVGLAQMALENLHAVTTGLVFTVIQANAEIERMTMLMRGMSDADTAAGAIEEANSQIDMLFEKAKDAPFSMRGISDAMVKIKAGGIDPMQGGLDALLNSVAAFGGDDQLLHRAAIAVQQMAGKGVISMEELRQQLGEAVPQAINLMARATGMSMREMVDVISSGTMESKAALARMFMEMEAVYGGAAKRMMTTWTGQVAKLRTVWMEFQRDIGSAGAGAEGDSLSFFELAKEQLRDLIYVLESSRGQAAAEQIGVALKDMTVAIRDGIDFVIKFKDEILQLGKALLVLYGTMKAVQIIRGFGKAIGNARTAIGTFRMDLERSGRQMRVQQAAVARLAGARGYGSFRTAALGASTAVRGLGKVLSALAGPIGIGVGLAIDAWVMGLIEFESKLEQSREAWEKLEQGITNSEVIAQVEEDIDNSATAIEKLNNAMKLIEQRGDPRKALYGLEASELVPQELIDRVKELGAGTMFFSEEKRREYERQAAALLKDIQDTIDTAANKVRDGEQRIANIRETERKEAAERSADAALLSLRRQLEDEQRLYNQHAKTYSEFADAQQLDAEQRTRELGVIRAAQYRNMMDFVQARLKVAEEAKKAAKEGTEEWLKQEAIITRLTELFNDLSGNLERSEKLSTPTTFLSGDEDTESNKNKESFLRYLASMKSRLAKTRAEMRGASGELAKLESKLKSGTWGDPDLLPADKLAEARKKAQELTEALEALEQKEEGMDALDKIAKKANDVAIAMEEAKRQFADPNAPDMNRGFGALQRQMAAALKEVKEGLSPEEYKRALARTQEIEQVYLNTSVYENAAAWQEKTRDIKASLATTVEERRAAANAGLRIEEERLRRIVAQFEGTEEEKREVVEASEAYIRALREQTARENEGSLEKMARDWSDVTGNLEDLTANWLDSMVDGFVEAAKTGKMEWGSLIEEILAGILKIQMQAQLSKSIMGEDGSGGLLGNLMGGAINFIGGMIGGGGGPISLLPSGASYGGGMVQSNAPIAGVQAGGLYHTGGIAGVENMMPIASLLSSAKRFHAGGFPGLRSDEVPAILQKGEGVFTKEQMRALGGSGGNDVQVNVINQSGQAMSAEQRQPRFDGEKMVLDIVLKHASRPGAFRNNLKTAISK
jgi:tape measure domain-containing protein